ncbi:M48 family metalloprotease [Blastococcus deserti]|uniref:Protease HtpX homolog n=1 Tax=Blastococcus deserti TaxID=2259033 RepID=A0ABW4X8Q8_9ACTN
MTTTISSFGPRLAGPPSALPPPLPTGRPRGRPVPHAGTPWSSRRVGNALRTAVLLAALGGLFVLVGSLFGRTGTLIGLALGLAATGGTYWFSDRLALRAAGAVPVDERTAPGYHRMVRELCAEAGLPMPRLYVTPDRQPNAFATGRGPRSAAVAVTQGLLDLLSPAEIRAVLAHELAHVANRDVLLTSVAAALATGIGAVANLAGWLPTGGDDEEGPHPFAALAAVLVAPVAAALLQLALSRSREFEADRCGAALLGNGRPLATALARIERAARWAPMQVAPTRASQYVVNPLTGLHGHSWTTLFQTHPPTAERIARLTGW